MYSIEIKSDFQEFWRYNLMVMCAGYNHSGDKLFTVSGQDIVAQIGDELQTKPDSYPANRVLNLETPPSTTLKLLIYVIPHTLPVSSDVDGSRPFTLQIEVVSRGESLYRSMESINQWSGASLQIDI